VIYEYALEPELVASLTERRNARYLAEKFGLGQPRLVSKYPKRWKTLAWEAFQQSHPNCSEGQKKIVEELIQRLSETMVRRPGAPFGSGRSWLENAEQEHARSPFRGILARANPRERDEVLVERDLDEQSCTLWAVARGTTVDRRARSMAKLIRPMLRCCGIVIFIDPYFAPDRIGYRRSLEAFLSALVESGRDLSSVRVEVQTKIRSTAEFFKGDCESRLGRHIPAGLSVSLRRWTERQGGEILHNRYILTDVGGLVFAHGLDEGKSGETDDVSLMDREQYLLRWRQYASDTPAFEPEEGPIVVMGSRRL
jgi:hypothetical protein